MKRTYENAVRATNKRYARKYIVARTAGSASFVGVVIMIAVTVTMIMVL